MRTPLAPPPFLRRPSSTPIQFIKGVGPHRAQILTKAGICSSSDLLFYFPRTHQDRRIKSLSGFLPGQKISIQALVLSASYRRVGPLLGQYTALVKDSSATIEAVWFRHLSYKYDVFSGVKKNVQPGKSICLYGQIEKTTRGLSLRVEEYEPVSETGEIPSNWNSILPIYPSMEGLGDQWFRQIMSHVVREESAKVTDYLPSKLRELHHLMPLGPALATYHFPSSWQERDHARERLAFDEFFFLELALEVSRNDRSQHVKGFSSVPTKKLLTPFKHQLGFEFTRSQTRAINQIFSDMAHPAPMYRLLQGDVGSGKTCVALSAALLSIENG